MTETGKVLIKIESQGQNWFVGQGGNIFDESTLVEIRDHFDCLSQVAFVQSIVVFEIAVSPTRGIAIRMSLGQILVLSRVELPVSMPVGHRRWTPFVS